MRILPTNRKKHTNTIDRKKKSACLEKKILLFGKINCVPCHVCTRGPCVQIKKWDVSEKHLDKPDSALNCSVLAVVAEDFVCGIASCEGRLLEEVELQEYVESCCAFLPYIIYNNGCINRNSNHLIICSLAGDRRNGITAVLSCQPKLKQQQNKQNKFINSTKRLRLYSWGYNKYFSLKKIH